VHRLGLRGVRCIAGLVTTPLALGLMAPRTITQGSSCLATLGFGTRPRWPLGQGWSARRGSVPSAWQTKGFDHRTLGDKVSANEFGANAIVTELRSVKKSNSHQ
jgi:hypothetical protein